MTDFLRTQKQKKKDEEERRGGKRGGGGGMKEEGGKTDLRFLRPSNGKKKTKQQGN